MKISEICKLANNGNNVSVGGVHLAGKIMKININNINNQYINK